VYPNPTYDHFTLALNGVDEEETIVAEIFNLSGEKISEHIRTGRSKYILSLESQPVGVYIIHVIAGKQAGVAKIIKR
jgi:hypothetical protein